VQNVCRAHIVVAAERAAARTRFAGPLSTSVYGADGFPPYRGSSTRVPIVAIALMIVVLLFAAGESTGWIDI